ncbi:unnamed protein product [Effrenium voratum]|uniref:WWE domain-containing protein n=1 Tax=Effrenium voratum TaxID=2562239 RepID=A0AA36MPN6_9DINO|nr:unnamed protein product [Effrenium voratum]CAJ1453133.1 unnamed protein product [Effrenium voratum]CAJ1461108.1 unnamed protein product [Effrenium voratum]
MSALGLAEAQEISISSDDEHEEQLSEEITGAMPTASAQGNLKGTKRSHAEVSDGESCELEFEGFDSDEEFIPRGAKLARPALLLEPLTCAAECEGAKQRPLPSQLQALLPGLLLSAPRELDAANVLTPEQTQAVQYVARNARPKSQAAVEGLQRRLAKWGYGHDTLAKVLRYIRDEAPIVIHTDLSKRVKAFSQDTHYRNQFETRTTSGSSDMSKRKAWEDRLFPQIYDNVQNFDRVKYGVLNAVNDPRGILSVAKQYGQDYLVLRGVRLRTTFSDRDSCTAGQQASCEWYAHVLEKYTDAELQAVTEVALGDRLFVDSSVLDTAAGGYKEVQIHGELEFKKHLEAVVVHHSRQKTKLFSAITEWCETIGVPLVCMPEYCDGTHVSHPTNESQLVAETPLWRWRPAETTGPWLRFDAIGSSFLEAVRGRDCTAFPRLPVGKICRLDLSAMAMAILVDNVIVELSLERRTAGAGAREQEAVAQHAGVYNFAWEWCASASGHGAWSKYDDTVSTLLEKAWEGSSSLTNFCISRAAYQVDLETMVQVNCGTKFRRLVRRRPFGS